MKPSKSSSLVLESSLCVSISKQFRQDLKRVMKQGKDIDTLKDAMHRLANQSSLPFKYFDHPLSGNWEGHRDCHLSPDSILIYKIDLSSVRFERMGTHAELFG